MKRILVTGGAGMIGRRLVARLAEAGHHVAVMDNLSSGLPPPERARFAHVDLRDGDGVGAFVSSFRPSFVFHLAAVHHVPTCEKLPSHCLAVNVTGTENVLRACELPFVEGMAMASSAAVYAPTEGRLAEDASLVEATDTYSLSKLTNERQGALWTARTGKPLRVARIFNTVGADDPNGHLFPEMIEQFRASIGQRVDIALGNLAPKRDYVDADDIADGLHLLQDDAGRGGFDIFNLCGGVEHSVFDIAHAVARRFGVDVEIRSDPARQRKNDRLSLLGSPAKMARRMGWRARRTLDDIVANVCDATKAPR